MKHTEDINIRFLKAMLEAAAQNVGPGPLRKERAALNHIRPEHQMFKGNTLLARETFAVLTERGLHPFYAKTETWEGVVLELSTEAITAAA